MENELRKYEMRCCKTNKSVVFSAYFYNAQELDNPDRLLLNYDMPIRCLNKNIECSKKCTTYNEFTKEFGQLEK